MKASPIDAATRSAATTEAAQPTVSLQPLAPLALPPEMPSVAAEGWRKVKPMGTWAIRFQVVALDSSIRHAASYLAGHEARFFAQPWALPNCQCCPQLFIGGFKTRAEAQRFLHRLKLPPEARKELDPPVITTVAALVKQNPACTFYAPEPK